jgi:hypothetical protein
VGCKGKGERKCKAVEIVRRARGNLMCQIAKVFSLQRLSSKLSPFMSKYPYPSWQANTVALIMLPTGDWKDENLQETLV